jgi:hypothetical protein
MVVQVMSKTFFEKPDDLRESRKTPEGAENLKTFFDTYGTNVTL